jgi:dihydroorotate dehydrogenase
MITSISSITGFIFKNFLKPILFKFDPENVHDRFTIAGRFYGSKQVFRDIFRKLFRYDDDVLIQKVDGNTFNNPVLLSAGFDKHADMMNILAPIGFSGMELGSITWKAYDGNPKPRLYRLPKSKGIVVYYGLKNLGVDATIAKIKKERIFDEEDKDFVFGVSIAKTNSKEVCSVEAGIEDYYQGLSAMNRAGVGDYYTINISCPNTYGGEPYTTPEKLEGLLKALDSIGTEKPVYIKMPINHEWGEFKKLLEVIMKHNIAGVIIGNLNKNHDDKNIVEKIPENLKGGVSGKPTFELSNALIRNTYKEYGEDLTIIGTGGIFTAEDAYTKIKAGASLVQMITGMIFGGPQVIGQINKGLSELVKADGYKNISEAVGVEV